MARYDSIFLDKENYHDIGIDNLAEWWNCILRDSANILPIKKLWNKKMQKRKFAFLLTEI